MKCLYASLSDEKVTHFINITIHRGDVNTSAIVDACRSKGRKGRPLGMSARMNHPVFCRFVPAIGCRLRDPPERPTFRPASVELSTNQSEKNNILRIDKNH